MRDYEEKSYYEIQLDNKQLILVFLAAVTVCVLIFVLGVMIGKGQKEAEYAATARNQKNSAPAEPDSNAPAQPLSDIASEAREVEDKAPPAEPAQEKQSQMKAEPKKEQKTEQKTEPPAPAAAVPEKAKQTFAYEDLDKSEETPAETKAKPVPAKTVAAQPEEEPKESGASRYTVQVMATSSKPKAQEQISKLKSRGYQPFLDETQSGGLMVFKVRVGRFADTKEANEMASKIKTDMKLETWVAVLD